jgi:FkbM family methyltransferase
MKRLMKKIVLGIINFILFFTQSKKNKARILSYASRILMSRDNNIVYDPSFDMYWLKSNDQYLYIVKKPYFNFSKEKLYRNIQKTPCRYYIPKKDDVVVDIGAGIGTETLFFNEKIQNQGKIYAIEASKSSYEKLVGLCVKNGIKNSENFNIAITDNNQKVWIEETENYQVDFINNDERGIEVDGLTLDSFIKQNKIEQIDFLKVNIEGAELQMIDGMKDTIRVTKNIAVSCHDFLFDDDRQIKKKMSDFLKRNNFELSFNETGNIARDSWIYGKKINK